MFKIIFLQRYYGLGDEQIEYQIKDRTSFRDFLGIECVGDVPDEKTVWKFKDILAKNGTMEKLFDEFHAVLEAKELILNEGKIIDASFVVVPRQRNTHEENKKIKNGEKCGSNHLREGVPKSPFNRCAERFEPIEIQGQV